MQSGGPGQGPQPAAGRRLDARRWRLEQLRDRLTQRLQTLEEELDEMDRAAELRSGSEDAGDAPASGRKGEGNDGEEGAKPGRKAELPPRKRRRSG